MFCDVEYFFPLWVKARADLKLVKLRPKDGAYNVNASHRLPASGRYRLVRARSVLIAPGVARWLVSLLRLSFFLFLMPSFPAVCDLWQDFPHSFNVLFTPSPDVDIANLDRLGCGHLISCNVLNQRRGRQPQFLCSLTSRIC